MTAAILSACVLLTGGAPVAPLIHTSSGWVRGTSEHGIDAFKGIPYAQPPVGRLRWHAPEPATAWTATRDASRFGNACLQRPRAALRATPSEDCLYLNVWRPHPLRAPAPILVWIHGGGDVVGAASQAVYDGSSFAKRGLVFVSFNYRLGRVGFFDHPALENAHEGPVGNFAIMDMIAALKWVQSNAAAFGGDPRRVTVMGESSGAASVVALLISPKAHGLFSQAIVLSGEGRDLGLGGLTSTTGPDNASTRGARFAHGYGIDGSDATALARLRALPASDLLSDVGIGLADRTTYTGGEIVDGSIIPSDPQTAFASGSANYVPILVGSTSDELAAIGLPCVADPFSFFGADEARARELYADVPATDPNRKSTDTIVVASDAGSTISANITMNESERYLAGVMTAHHQVAWLDRFGYVPTARRSHQRLAPHASDNPFTFDTLPNTASAQDHAMADSMNAYFANFALHGNPNAPGLPAWLPYAPGDERLMDFTSDRGPVFERDPIADRLDLIAKVRNAKHIVYRSALPSTNFVFGCTP
ncbi:MAG: carboxylesterase family protein [bacterium]|nr:carboxylesterase family protein [bacterium]